MKQKNLYYFLKLFFFVIMNQISDFDKSPRTPMSKSPLALTPPKSPINEYKSPLPMQDLNIAKKLI